MNIKKLLLLAAWVLPLCATAQKLVENKVDDFTKAKVKRTTWEPICREAGFYAYAKASSINDQNILSIKFMGKGSVYSISEKDQIMIMLQNDSIISLNCMKYTLSCKGCGATGLVGSNAYGISADYAFTSEQRDFLINNKVKKIRVYTSVGYSEGEIKEKFAETFIKELELIK